MRMIVMDGPPDEVTLNVPWPVLFKRGVPVEVSDGLHAELLARNTGQAGEIVWRDATRGEAGKEGED